MDLIDIIIYIVLCFFGFVSTFITKKKPQATQNTPPPHQENGDINEDGPPYSYEIEDEEAGYEDILIEEPRSLTEEPAATQPAQPASSSMPPLTLDEIFRALREGRPPTPPQPAPATQPVTAPRPQVVATTTEPIQPITPRQEMKKPSEITKKTEIENEISDTGVYDEEAAPAFDIEQVNWQQAIITQEILSRKYE